MVDFSFCGQRTPKDGRTSTNSFMLVFTLISHYLL
jgi:hypothetical protein